MDTKINSLQELSIRAYQNEIDRLNNVITLSENEIAVYKKLIEGLYDYKQNTLKPEFVKEDKVVDYVESPKALVPRKSSQEIPSEWADSLTFVKKVLYIISQHQSCTSAKITKELIRRGVDSAVANRLARQNVFNLKKAGIIEVISEGSGKIGAHVRIKEKTA